MYTVCIIQAARDKGIRRSNQKNGGKTFYSPQPGLGTKKTQISQVNTIQYRPEGSTINRWKKATGSNVPLRDYAKKVLADRK